MDFYLSFNNNEEQLRLPVIPSEFDVSQRHNNTVVNITSLGDIGLIGKSGLSTINLSSFFPSKEYYFCKYNGFPSPYDCVKMIQSWKKNCKPIRLIVTETPLNMSVTIENFSYGERDGTGDVYFTLELKEYIFTVKSKPEAITTSNGTKVTVPSTKRETKPIPKTYKPQKNDTIYTVAKKTTGNMANANAIAERNKMVKAMSLNGRELRI